MGKDFGGALSYLWLVKYERFSETGIYTLAKDPLEAAFEIIEKRESWDLDRNIALYYLVGTLNISDITLSMVREIDSGERVWQESENCHGVTLRGMQGE